MCGANFDDFNEPSLKHYNRRIKRFLVINGKQADEYSSTHSIKDSVRGGWEGCTTSRLIESFPRVHESQSTLDGSVNIGSRTNLERAVTHSLAHNSHKEKQ